MPSSLNADNGVVSGTAGLKSSADSSGVLDLQTNGTTAISISASQVVTYTNQPTYTGGTANGVMFLNGSKAVTTGTALTFDGAILGVNGISVGRGAGAVSTNTAVGASALAANTSATNVVAIGNSALPVNTTGIDNVAVGSQAMFLNTTGQNNTATGRQALYSNTTGGNNTAFGYGSLISNTTASNNTAVGYQAGYSNTTGGSNSFFGPASGYSNTTGTANTFVGYEAGYYCTTGSGNTLINPRTATNAYSPVFALTTENNRFIAGSASVTNAYINVAWTVVSDLRDKVVLGDVPLGLDFVRKLKPIKYQFKQSRESNTPTGVIKYGFGAQDILVEEGDSPVIVDTEVTDKLKITDSHMMPVFANAIKEMADMIDQLKAEIATLKGN